MRASLLEFVETICWSAVVRQNAQLLSPPGIEVHRVTDPGMCLYHERIAAAEEAQPVVWPSAREVVAFNLGQRGVAAQHSNTFAIDARQSNSPAFISPPNFSNTNLCKREKKPSP